MTETYNQWSPERHEKVAVTKTSQHALIARTREGSMDVANIIFERAKYRCFMTITITSTNKEKTPEPPEIINLVNIDDEEDWNAPYVSLLTTNSLRNQTRDPVASGEYVAYTIVEFSLEKPPDPLQLTILLSLHPIQNCPPSPLLPSYTTAELFTDPKKDRPEPSPATAIAMVQLKRESR
ncbi:hypothetical protein VKT23_018506 [Stygiomarasmius scandens]|uniref:Uncharacterized protein n=1 Tax=Marasmiellus scandens TaxID=2682957 RepID=A0ABR1ITC3_9AGAR